MKANQKRLYDHYIKIGYKLAAEDMVKKHPWLVEKEGAPDTLPATKEEEEEEPKPPKKRGLFGRK